jgi:hypothetical protein
MALFFSGKTRFPIARPSPAEKELPRPPCWFHFIDKELLKIFALIFKDFALALASSLVNHFKIILK